MVASNATLNKPTPAAPANVRTGASLVSRILRKWATIGVMIAVLIGFSFATPYFLTVSNFTNVVFNMVTGTFAALGLTYVVVAGSFDLSIGLVVMFTSILTALTMPYFGPVGACAVALAAAGLVGLVNGLLVTYGRLSGIVVTLGMMFVLGGVNNYVTRGYEISISSTETGFLFLGTGNLFDIPVPDFILAAVFVVGYFVSSKTRVGHYLRAVGDNPMAGYYSGIRVYLWVTLAFVLSAVISGVGGVILTAVSSSAQPVGGEGYLLDSFAAVFLGATVLGHGRPHFLGTIVAAFFINLVTSGMNMVGAPFAIHELFEGIVLIAAVGANALLNREELHMNFF